MIFLLEVVGDEERALDGLLYLEGQVQLVDGAPVFIEFPGEVHQLRLRSSATVRAILTAADGPVAVDEAVIDLAVIVVETAAQSQLDVLEVHVLAVLDLRSFHHQTLRQPVEEHLQVRI